MKKKFLIIFVIIILSFAAFIYLFLADNEPSVTEKPSINALDTIRDGEKTGKSVALSEKDINGILAVYLKDGKTAGGFHVKSVNIAIEENRITLNAWVGYHGIYMKVSTLGSVSYVNPNLIFKPDSFSVGKIPIPKRLVLSAIEKKGYKGILVSKEAIGYAAQNLPVKIQSMVVKENKIILTLNKLSIGDLLNGITQKESNGGQSSNIQQSNSKSSKPQDTTETGSVKTGNSTANPSTNAGITKNQPKGTKGSETTSALARMNGQLGAALGDVISSKSREIIGIMQSTVSQLEQNSAYNSAGNVASVKAIYATLSPEEKTNLKMALFSHVDFNNAMQLKNTFGL